jgi:hypothetical protein
MCKKQNASDLNVHAIIYIYIYNIKISPVSKVHVVNVILTVR